METGTTQFDQKVLCNVYIFTVPKRMAGYDNDEIIVRGSDLGQGARLPSC
jgi:hypothetical protein